MAGWSANTVMTTHVRKKVDAWGSFVARRLGMPVGFFTRLGSAAIIPELIYTIKKLCYMPHR